MCECCQVGGPFIAEDPDCPEHGTAAQKQQHNDEYNELTKKAVLDLAFEVAAWRMKFPKLEYRNDKIVKK